MNLIVVGVGMAALSATKQNIMTYPKKYQFGFIHHYPKIDKAVSEHW